MPVREGQVALKTTHRMCFSLNHKQKATRSSQKPPRWFWGGGGPALLLEQHQYPWAAQGARHQRQQHFPAKMKEKSLVKLRRSPSCH